MSRQLYMTLSSFAIIFFTSITTLADDTCTIKIPAGTTVESRTRVLKTADGRLITVIGQNHGERLELRRIGGIANFKSDSNDLWRWTLDSILKSNKQAIKDATDEVKYISELLKKNSEIKYVGLEMEQETLPDHIKYSKKVSDDLLSEISRRKITDMATTPYVLGFSGSAVYLRMTEPGLLKNKIFFGVESPEAASLHSEKLQKYDETLSKLKNQIEISTLEGQDFMSKIHETTGELLLLYPAYTSELDEKIMTAALGKTPEKYKKAMSNWISASFEEMKAMKKRDEKIAESIYSRDGSAIVTLGYAHLDSVMSILAKKCEKEASTVKLISPAGVSKAGVK